jgi:hypothetical protein
VTPPADLAARLSAVLGEPATDAAPVLGGYTAAARWRVTLASGRTAFAKLGTTALTAAALRDEAAVYAALRGPFMPALLGWQDDPQRPLLVLEDLGAADWPPPWTDDRVAAVRRALDALHANPARLRPVAHTDAYWANGWQRVSEDPAPFLGLGLTTDRWLEAALPALLQASAAVRVEGDQVVHLDVRSDNLCIAPRGAVLIDWNCACLANGDLDTAFWLPSLQAEGGPEPERLVGRRPDLAAMVSGYFASRAGLPPIPEAPRVRLVQKQQLGPALAWAVRALALSDPLRGGQGAA